MPFKSIISASSICGKKSLKKTSSEAQIIPNDSSPRILVFSIFTGSPCPCQTTTAPGLQTTTYSPTYRLEPPHTIWTGDSSPIFTIHTFNLSASGCLFTSNISPTMISWNLREVSITSSTSTVLMVKS